MLISFKYLKSIWRSPFDKVLTAFPLNKMSTIYTCFGTRRLTKKDDTSDTGKPSSASLIAGARICASDTLPLPNLSTQSTQPAAAPGTVTEWTLVVGMFPIVPSAMPRAFLNCLSSRFALLRPEPFNDRILLVFESKNRQNISPPMPVEEGSVTLSAAATA